MSARGEALWANRIQRLCLLETDNIDDALAAAEVILSTQPAQEDSERSTSDLLRDLEGWITVPDSFLQSSERVRVAMSVDPPKPPDIVIHNHVAAPIINVPTPQVTVEVAAPTVNVPQGPAPVVNIETPKQEPPDVVVNVPKQEPPVVNVSAPVVHVAAPQVTVESSAPVPTPPGTRKVSLKKSADGVWTGEVRENV